ncbi:MAG: hypothetical protein ACTHM6_05935 [Tepidisphaeraceae bacterium]
MHKFMRKHFMPFLYEHGLERPMVPATGIACTNHAGYHIRLGYELGVGFYDWSGNDLRLAGTITSKGQLKRSLQANIVQPDDLLPTPLRTDLRELGIRQLVGIIAVARTQGREVPTHLHDALRAAERDHLFVPDFRYQSEQDLEQWCDIVRPQVAVCVAGLKTEAFRLREDAKA